MRSRPSRFALTNSSESIHVVSSMCQKYQKPSPCFWRASTWIDSELARAPLHKHQFRPRSIPLHWLQCSRQNSKPLPGDGHLPRVHNTCHWTGPPKWPNLGQKWSKMILPKNDPAFKVYGAYSGNLGPIWGMFGLDFMPPLAPTRRLFRTHYAGTHSC